VAFAAIWKDRLPFNFIVKRVDFYPPDFRCRVDILFTLYDAAPDETLFYLRRGTDSFHLAFLPITRICAPTLEIKMRNAFAIAAIFALTTALSSTATFAQSGGGGGGASAAGSASGSASAQADANLGGRRIHQASGANSLARADVGTHGMNSRHVARMHRANRTGFCPPGQAKKPGSGSRYQC
jgi:hypothetical protein